MRLQHQRLRVLLMPSTSVAAWRGLRTVIQPKACQASSAGQSLPTRRTQWPISTSALFCAVVLNALGHCQKHTCAGQSRLIRSALLAIGSLLGTWSSSVTIAALQPRHYRQALEISMENIDHIANWHTRSQQLRALSQQRTPWSARLEALPRPIFPAACSVFGFHL